MSKHIHQHLSRRERQIVDILYAQRSATVAEVRAALPDPPGYSAVRALLAILEEKGLVSHTQVGKAYRYSPTVSRAKARQSALNHVVRTFFDGSVAGVVTALVDLSDRSLSDEEIDRLEQLVRRKRRQKQR